MPEHRSCRQCSARLIWARTVANNLVALDMTPSPRGTYALIDGMAVTVGTSLFDPLIDGARYTQHQCPKVAKHES